MLSCGMINSASSSQCMQTFNMLMGGVLKAFFCIHVKNVYMFIFFVKEVFFNVVYYVEIVSSLAHSKC
jgi:hypothetical protein